MPADMESKPSAPEPGAEEAADKRSWLILFSFIAVCFTVGLAFLVFAVWLDWN